MSVNMSSAFNYSLNELMVANLLDTLSTSMTDSSEITKEPVITLEIEGECVGEVTTRLNRIEVLGREILTSDSEDDIKVKNFVSKRKASDLIDSKRPVKKFKKDSLYLQKNLLKK